ncbi:Ragulator complex protein LAMTOR5-like protein [Zancudomyces culisetae]|uniref:Late endosomal/lysosomal adaptor and MAPK and MTOR activator 5 n=1 Tax=Zancudomyces culisetae TaxID=1213189 RepID=A0A1R1PWE5_ZANCU|nr:Ragulator complex protein LAMTOR5-like protein [Zancudomyces culisetae]|eukprot:OMH85233.1 Ragulator complex protein LAMTOR5-like protein [Zancudomyces culisetae]
METQVEHCIEKIIQDKDVVGVLVIDDTGLCVSKWGNVNQGAAGLVFSISRRAEYVYPEDLIQNQNPCIIIESADKRILVKRQYDWTLCIVKKN